MTENTTRNNYIIAAKSIAPFPIIMAIFMLAYAVWFGIAWGAAGWASFTLFVAYAIWLIFQGVSNVRVSAKLPDVEFTELNNRIGKQMQILSMWTYIPLWIVIILLIVFGKYAYIMPAVTLIVGIHFLPQAKIFDRKIDYFLAPVPMFTALIAAYIATVSDTPWQIVFAISSIGGVVATASYGLYLAVQCQQLIKKI